jgi:hypothetical protein
MKKESKITEKARIILLLILGSQNIIPAKRV